MSNSGVVEALLVGVAMVLAIGCGYFAGKCVNSLSKYRRIQKIIEETYSPSRGWRTAYLREMRYRFYRQGAFALVCFVLTSIIRIATLIIF